MIKMLKVKLVRKMSRFNKIFVAVYGQHGKVHLYSGVSKAVLWVFMF
jgi:hypothetical protein